jgi:hypothetical protein
VWCPRAFRLPGPDSSSPCVKPVAGVNPARSSAAAGARPAAEEMSALVDAHKGEFEVEPI